MKDKYVLTAESVTEGHPDKLCDTIADAVVDACLEHDPAAHVACEVMATAGKIIAAGEITAAWLPDIPAVICRTVREAGYGGSDYEVEVITHEQSPDIAGAVNNGAETGAGDQGIVYGYACDETPELLPLPVVLAHKLTRLLTQARKLHTIPSLKPDGKAQVSVEYQFGVPKRVSAVVVSCQHEDGVELAELRHAVMRHIKTISGKVNLVKMLKETRDVRRFAMSPEQYQAFKKKAGKQKILFSAIRDTDGHGKVVDVIMPVTEIDRANMIFERIHYLGRPEQAQQPPREQAPSKAREARERQAATQVEQDRRPQEDTPVTPPVGQRQEVEPKKGSRSGQDLPATAPSSTSSKDGSRMTSEERPSVLERLKGYKTQLDQQQKPAPARTKDRQKSKTGKAK